MIMEYTLVRSRRKTLAIEVTREGKVVVRAPSRCPMEYIEGFLAEKAGWIEKSIAAQLAKMAAHPEPTLEREAELRELAVKTLPDLVEKYSKIMGLEPKGLTVTGARTRFGSCSGKDRLSFSFRLMDYPTEAVEYVVVHELAHIKHKNHGTEFYRLVATVLPDWQERRQMLKR